MNDEGPVATFSLILFLFYFKEKEYEKERDDIKGPPPSVSWAFRAQQGGGIMSSLGLNGPGLLSFT